MFFKSLASSLHSSSLRLLNGLVFMLLALSSLSAWADWHTLASTPEGTYYHEDPLQKDGAQISFWRMTDFAKPLTNLEGKEILSEKTFTTIDCSSGKLGNTQMTRYAKAQAQGEIMNHYETPLRLTRIAPDSLDAALLKKICH